MLHATSRKRKAKASPAPAGKYVGIVADAAALGVERTHLWRVLHGHRQSKSLLRRYRSLKQQQTLAA